MAPPLAMKSALIILLVTPSLVLGQHQPYFFNYQPQPQQQQFQHGGTYQPFTNAPPGAFYQPTYQTHTAGGGNGGDILSNYFGRDLPSPTPAVNPLIPYPTQVTTVHNAPRPSSAAGGVHQPQSFQPIGNSIVQQSPSVTTNVANANVFRPSAPITNHHTHIVNGLPRQQFFGNNYEFFRQRHGLTLPTTTGPFLHNTLSGSPASGSPLGGVQPQSPTPPVFISSSAGPLSSAGAPASKPNHVVEQQQPRIASPPSTHPTIIQNFPTFHGPSGFPPDSKQGSKPTPSSSNNPIVASLQSARPTAPSVTSGVSPSFAFSQYFPETGDNELPRQPLFGSDDDEEEEDDETYNNNGGNSIYQPNNNRQPQQQSISLQRPPQQQSISLQRPPQQAPIITSSVPAAKSPQSSFSSGGVNVLNTQAKDEAAPVRIHNTAPIRIVFNYEQAIAALEETPGIRIVIANTDKNNLTNEESTEAPVLQSTARSVSTTARPVQIVSTTYRPAQPPPTSRFQYQPVNIPYTGTTTTTTAELENLALELEGRFGATGRPGFASARPILETVATYATEESPTESSVQNFKRGQKKFIILPNSDNVIRAPEPRVVVNDLASIVVQTLPPSATAQPTAPVFPQRVTYQQPRYQEVQEEVAQEVDNEDLEHEIQNLQQELQTTIVATSTTTTPTTTTTPSPPRPRPRTTPAPRLRPTTYRPATTYQTSRRPPPTPEQIPEAPEEAPELGSLTGRSQSPHYLYNNKNRGGLSGAHQRYEYNGVDASPQDEQVKPRRKLRPRGRLIAGSPPRAVQVVGVPSALGPLVGPEEVPSPLHVSPVAFGPGGPLPGSPIVGGPGPVYRVGPRGRLLRRKTRPRGSPSPPQAVEHNREAVQLSAPPTPPAFPLRDFPPQVPQELNSDGPQLYSPTPFIPPAPLVTTFRPGPPPNFLVQQSIVLEEDDQRRGVRVEPPTTLRTSRFKFSPRPTASIPSRPAAPVRPVLDDDEQASNQFESEEEAPVQPPPQRRRPQSAASTTTTEEPAASSQVVGDRANILQRQIRFNKNRQKSNQRS